MFQNQLGWGWHLVTTDELFDPKNGYLTDDTLTLHADVTLCMGLHATVDRTTKIKRLSSTGPGPQHDDTRSDLLKKLAGLYESKMHSDFVLISSDDVEFPTHRVILAMNSEVFDAMLKPHTVEAESARCVISDVDGETLKALLQHIYTGTMEHDPDLTEKLLIAADKYGLLALVDVCVQHLTSSLTTKNAAKLLVMGNNYGIVKLSSAVCEFFGNEHDPDE